MSRLFRGEDRSRGQGLVELAVVLPIIMLLLLALFDAGRGVLFYTELTNASRAGARVAMVNQSNDTTCSGTVTFKCAAADVTTGMGIAPSDISNVEIEPSGSDCALPSNCTAKVTVAYRFELITPIISALISDVDLSASTTMPIERIYQNP